MCTLPARRLAWAEIDHYCVIHTDRLEELHACIPQEGPYIAQYAEVQR